MSVVSSVTEAATVAASHPVTVQVINQGPGIWGNVATGLITAGAAIAAVMLTHRFTLKREKLLAQNKQQQELHYLATELAFLLERYASGWVSLMWFHMHQYREGTAPIPDLDLSPAAGDWRALPSVVVFRLRSLEEEHRELARVLLNKPDPEFLPEPGYLRLRCYKLGIKAFLLAGRMRRLADLPDSPQMKGNTGTLMMLKRGRRSWLRFRNRERAESKVALEKLLKTEVQSIIN